MFRIILRTRGRENARNDRGHIIGFMVAWIDRRADIRRSAAHTTARCSGHFFDPSLYWQKSRIVRLAPKHSRRRYRPGAEESRVGLFSREKARKCYSRFAFIR